MADIITKKMSKLKSAAYPYLQKARYAKFIALFEKAKRLPMKENAILMYSTSKGKLGGNLLAIKQYIENNALPYEILTATSDCMPDEETLAKEMAQSKFILVDDYEPLVYVLKLKEGQRLVQVWHAMGAFKRFGYMRETAEKNSLTHKNYTDAIVSSPEIIPIYAKSFGIDEKKVKAIGTPRTDCFFDESYVAAAKDRLYHQYPLLKGKKICLFAPTFRGNQVDDADYPSEFLNLTEFARSLGEEWAVILKMHPFVKRKTEIPDEVKDRVFDLSEEREINEILLITDVLVTDYSSVIFENAVIGNAAVMYVPDLDEYHQQRGFYYRFEEYACGEIVTDQRALAEAVRNADAGDERMTAFQKRFVPLCDGNSSARFVNTILEEK